ncbi:hypothetical protein [Rhizobium leguminosarum]|uniref:hypothetical protein n=1 Tax=Rhizobium leguminosarum TaxID=384 RepID=UPI003F993C12
MKGINKGLSNYTIGRTVSVKVDIERAKATLEREMITGDIKQRCDENGELHLNHMDISRLAGRHWNLLNSGRHKGSTRDDVEAFLRKLHLDFKELYPANPPKAARRGGGGAKSPGADEKDTELERLQAELESVKIELTEVNARLERVASHVHTWAQLLRSARAEIRRLRVEKPPTIVPLTPPSRLRFGNPKPPTS